MQSPRDKDTARMSQWERTMGGSRPQKGTLPQLAESQCEMSSDTEHRSAKRYAELEEAVGGKKGGSSFFNTF